MNTDYKINIYFTSQEFDTEFFSEYINSDNTLSPVIKCFRETFSQAFEPPQKIRCLARFKHLISTANETNENKGCQIDLKEAQTVFTMVKDTLPSLGNTALYGCKEGNWSLLKDLETLEFDFNLPVPGPTPNSDSWPIHLATFCNQEDVALWLLKKNVNCQTSSIGLHLIHGACRNNLFKLTRELLKRGANPNQASGSFYYPLHYSCAKGRPNRTDVEKQRVARFALLLFAYGADPALRDRRGKKAIENLSDQNDNDGAKWIKEAFKATIATNDNLLRVPVDIWKSIFRNLRGEDIFSAHRVCKKWRQVISMQLSEQFISGKIW